MNLTVDRTAKQHYRDGERRFFSVSQIRQVAFQPFVSVPFEILEAARIRGQLVHTFLWRHLAARAGIVPFPPHTATIEGYCKSIENWAEVNRVLPVRLEYRSCNRKHGYAGQVDAQIHYGKKQTLTLMDGKSGQPVCTEIMQMLLYNEMDDLKSDLLLDVYFQADGSTAKERIITAKDRPFHWAWAMNSLGVLRGRANMGVL